ncbi:acyl carrier protein [Massilia sp. DWR3-1-1]|uniref:acyl carrier protein n=1 Tax=Massilia sp. DWR3-1-1 TaxID=2804559 RepID=UPI003CEFAC8B
MYINEIKEILINCLGLGSTGQLLRENSRLLGSIPELDSMAVIGLVGELEDHFGIVIADDDISASTFETLASLNAFIELKKLE